MELSLLMYSLLLILCKLFIEALIKLLVFFTLKIVYYMYKNIVTLMLNVDENADSAGCCNNFYIVIAAFIIIIYRMPMVIYTESRLLEEINSLVNSHAVSINIFLYGRDQEIVIIFILLYICSRTSWHRLNFETKRM